MSYITITALTEHQRLEAVEVAGILADPDIEVTRTTVRFESPTSVIDFRKAVGIQRNRVRGTDDGIGRNNALASLERKCAKAVHKAETTCPPSVAKHLAFLTK